MLLLSTKTTVKYENMGYFFSGNYEDYHSYLKSEKMKNWLIKSLCCGCNIENDSIKRTLKLVVFHQKSQYIIQRLNVQSTHPLRF